MVDYARDVIYEPYFRTQVKVFVIAALFMYISIFLILPVRPQHRVPHPVPPHERELHRREAFQHDQGQAALLPGAAAVQRPRAHARRDQAPLRRGEPHDHGHPWRDPLRLRFHAETLGAGDADDGAEEPHLPVHRHPRLHLDQRIDVAGEGRGDAQPLPRPAGRHHPGERRGRGQVRRGRSHGHVRRTQA